MYFTNNQARAIMQVLRSNKLKKERNKVPLFLFCLRALDDEPLQTLAFARLRFDYFNAK